MADNDRDIYAAWVEFVKAQKPQPMDVFDPLDAVLLHEQTSESLWKDVLDALERFEDE